MSGNEKVFRHERLPVALLRVKDYCEKLEKCAGLD